jgi:hypothetical protein
MGHEHVELFKAAFIEEKFDPFTGGQLALGVLRIHPARATALTCHGAAGLKLLQDVLHRGVPLPLDFAQHTGGERGGKANFVKFANYWQIKKRELNKCKFFSAPASATLFETGAKG